MNGVIVGALVALSMAQQKTDTIFPVQDATTLEVSIPGGTIAVTGWDRNEVRVQADHSMRTTIEVRRNRGGSRVTLESEARRGPGGIVDFQISVPRSMALDLGGMYTDINVDGVNGAVDAGTMQGDITVKGAGGPVKASTTTGALLLEGARGKVDANAVAGDIRLVNVSGDVTAESVGGDIIFENAQASSVDVGTTGGQIRYDGTLSKTGTYLFGSYVGEVTLILPEGTAASLSLSTAHGSVLNNMSGEMQRLERGKRHNVELGGGGAVVEVETFGGRIAVLKKGTESEVRERSRSWGEPEDWGDVGAWAAHAAEGEASRWTDFGEALGRMIGETAPRIRVDSKARWEVRAHHATFPGDTLPATIRP